MSLSPAHTEDVLDVRTQILGALPALPTDALASLVQVLEELETIATLESRVDWIEHLTEWIRRAHVGEIPSNAPVASGSPSAALWALVHLLESDPDLTGKMAKLLGEVVHAGTLVPLLHQVGLARDPRLVGEASHRLLRRFMPQPPDDSDLSVLVERLFPDAASTEWFEHAPPRVVLRLFELFAETDQGTLLRRRLLEDAMQAVGILSVQVSALGLQEDVRSRCPGGAVSESPFAQIPEQAQILARSVGAGDLPQLKAGQVRMQQLLELGRAWQIRASKNLDRGGISVDLVYRVDLLERSLQRLRRLVGLLDRGPEDGPDTVRLLRDLVRSSLLDRSVTQLFRQNSQLLARRLVERAGETGEHYITDTNEEWKGLLRSAAGGGLLTVFTAAAKVGIVGLHLPGLWELGLSWLNYSGSFLLMQSLHCTLATKQPAMTAATIAAGLGDDEHHVDAIANLMARATRSQFAAALGNVGAVIPGAFALHIVWLLATGHGIMNLDKAEHTVAGLHPFASGTLWYAFITGCVLWLGSILGGTVENWTAVQRVPERIAGSRRLRRLLGRDRTHALGASFGKNISGIATNIALGGLLAIVPMLGQFTGVPFDVRHVTLAMGQLTLALATEGPSAFLHTTTSFAVVGVLAVLFLNFSVSFALAISVAVRARGIPEGQVRAAVLAVFRQAVLHPLRFLTPPPARSPDP